MNEKELIVLAKSALEKLKANGRTLAVAESCTGGWLSKIITDVSGASECYMGGVCSYSNDVKMKLLSVKSETLDAYGAVSEQTAREMAEGVRRALGTDIGIGITGIAGPLSDNTKKPVGLIYISLCDENGTTVKKLENTFSENVRENNRFSAVKCALTLLGNRYEK